MNMNWTRCVNNTPNVTAIAWRARYSQSIIIHKTNKSNKYGEENKRDGVYSIKIECTQETTEHLREL